MRDLHDIRAKDEQAFKAQIDKLQQEKKQLQDTVLHYQSSDHKQKQEFEQMLFRVQDMLERERQEKFSSIAEQKSLRQQVENMSKTMKTLQVTDSVKFTASYGVFHVWFNPLRPGIKLQILLSCFHTFITDVKGRSCSNINRISFE